MGEVVVEGEGEEDPHQGEVAMTEVPHHETGLLHLREKESAMTAEVLLRFPTTEIEIITGESRPQGAHHGEGERGHLMTDMKAELQQLLLRPRPSENTETETDESLLPAAGLRHLTEAWLTVSPGD